MKKSVHKRFFWSWLMALLLALGMVVPVQAEATPLAGASFASVYRHVMPFQAEEVVHWQQQTLSETVWRNDVLEAKVVVWAREDLTQVTVSTQGLDGLGPADIRWLQSTRANIGNADPEAPVLSFPDIIGQSGATQIEAGHFQCAWISIPIPAQAKPGKITGSIVIEAEPLAQPLRLQLQLEVLDLEVPSPQQTGMQIEFWQHPYTSARYYGVEPFSIEHAAFLLPQLREYAQMGGSSVIANIVEEAWNHQSYDSDPSMIRWIRQPDGTIGFDYTEFDRWIELAITAGVLDPDVGAGQIKAYSVAPWGNIVTLINEEDGSRQRLMLEVGSESWRSMWTVFLEDFMRHTKQKGWFELVALSMDERDEESMRLCIELIHSIRDDQGQSFRIAAQINDVMANRDLLDQIDDLSIGLSQIDDRSDSLRQLCQRRRQQGQITTLYTCTGHYPSAYTISDMADPVWVMWYTMKQGTDGFLRWSWDGWVEDPLQEVTYRTFEPGDPWLIYPAPRNTRDEVFYSSPRYQMLKQGIRDVSKARLLRSLSLSMQQQVDELVVSLRRPQGMIDRYGSAVYASEADRELTQQEVIRMREGIHELSRQALAAGLSAGGAAKTISSERIVVKADQSWQPTMPLKRLWMLSTAG